MYSNSKNQISLEEAYRKVHTDPVEEINEDFATAHEIIANSHNTREEIMKFLPEVFGAATLALAWGHREAAEMIAMLMRKLNIGKIEQVLSPLEQEKQALEAKAKHNMEAQAELNSKIDEILKEGSLEALEQLYKADGHNIPITKLLKALEGKLKDRVDSRK
jgi:hypothetical protein